MGRIEVGLTRVRAVRQPLIRHGGASSPEPQQGFSSTVSTPPDPERRPANGGPWPPPLGELEVDFLQAAADLTQHQAELSAPLTPQLGISPYEYWIRVRVDGEPPPATLKHEYRRYEQRVRVGDWEIFFHGLECDVENVRDGRFVRIDFGPHTRPSALSGFGVMQYVMCAREPWTPFPALRDWLAETGPPYHCLSGCHAKMVDICGRLASAKAVQTCGLGHLFSASGV